ncbi:hypothetical protein [Roseimicrobium sp. ORNL1]|uniref:hypothetical protein n=1 Tax=Roseimicrobium sp. ORNL1 TaxID=2711231 RepID=UPI0013E1D37F|nr:hypothetical protein [Roseimicrobium sp. ORNL1]QIF03229.1 hypothetical protein G5S37_17430 [Roseimicrobium sp. ORNL1]
MRAPYGSVAELVRKATFAVVFREMTPTPVRERLRASVRLIMLITVTAGAGIHWMPTFSGMIHFPTASFHMLELLRDFWIPLAQVLVVFGMILGVQLLLFFRDRLGVYALILGVTVFGDIWKWGIAMS